MRTILKQTVLAFSSLIVMMGLLTGCQPANGQAASANVLNLYGVDPQTLDPAISGDGNSHQYVLQIYSGLLMLDDNLKPAPDIARDWQVSPDGKTYTFHLRQDAKFQDGRGVKAQDFKYSWERATDPATGSLTASNYLGDIVGAKEKLAGKSNELSGVRVIDDYTLAVTIDAPKAYFLSKMTYPTAFVVDSNNVKTGRTWWRTPNGTGAFKLQEWTPANRVVLSRNALYYGQMAKLDSVVFQLFGGVPMDLYETGQIDAAGTSVIYIDRVTDPAGPFLRELTTAPELSFYYIGFNTSKPPFNDPNIRRAFSLALDKEKMVSLIFRDTMKLADGILPPGIPGFNPALAGLKYNVAEAKRLISQSKYGSAAGLPPIIVTTSGRGAGVSHDLEAAIYQWRQNLGVDVKVRQLEPERYFYNLKDEVDNMFDMGWIADYPHPQDFLEILFRTGSENNYGGYSSAEVDDLLTRAGVELDEQKSLALYQQAEQRIVNDAAVIPLLFGRNFTLVKPYVKGYTLNPLGLVMLNRVSVEPH